MNIVSCPWCGQSPVKLYRLQASNCRARCTNKSCKTFLDIRTDSLLKALKEWNYRATLRRVLVQFPDFDLPVLLQKTREGLKEGLRFADLEKNELNLRLYELAVGEECFECEIVQIPLKLLETLLCALEAESNSAILLVEET